MATIGSRAYYGDGKVIEATPSNPKALPTDGSYSPKIIPPSTVKPSPTVVNVDATGGNQRETAPPAAAPAKPGGDLGPGYATLYDPKNPSARVPVQVNSDEAKKFFSQGYLLEPTGKGGTKPSINFEPTGIIPAEDLKKASENPDLLPDFFGKAFEGVQKAQQDVITVRDQQNKNIDDLTSARQAEGLTQAQDELNQINSRIAAYNTAVQNIENDVRNDLPGASESFVQAEIQRRSHDLQAEGNRLVNLQAAAQAKLQYTVDRTSERFGAVRADAAEEVNQAVQKYGFKTDNINMATSLLTNMKQLDILNDQQRSAKRAEGQATLALLLSQPSALKNLNSVQMAAIESAAGVPAGFISEVRDSILAKGDLIAQIVDSNGDYNAFFFDPKTNTYTTKRWSGFSAPQKTAVTVANQKLYSNLNERDKGIFSVGTTLLNQIAQGKEGAVTIKAGDQTFTFGSKREAATAVRSYVLSEVVKNPSEANIRFFDSIFNDQVGKAVGEPSSFDAAFGRAAGEASGSFDAAGTTAANLDGK